MDDHKIDLSINPELANNKEFMDDILRKALASYSKYADMIDDE